MLPLQEPKICNPKLLRLAIVLACSRVKKFVVVFGEMSASSGFPLRRDIVVDNFEDFHKLGQEFKDSSCDLLPEADDSFAGAPEMPGPLWAECHPDACPHALPGRQRKAYSTLIDLVLETIMRQAPRPSCPMEEPLLLQFSAPTARGKRYAAVAYNSRKKPIDAVLVGLSVLPREQVPEGALFTLACEKSSGGSLTCLGDKRFCVELVKLADDWEMATLKVGPVRFLHLFDVVAIQPVDIDSLRRQLQQEKDAKQALGAFKLLTKKRAPPAKRRREGQHGKASGKGKEKRSADAAELSDPADGGGSSESASDARSDSEPEDPVASGLVPQLAPAAASLGQPRAVRRNVRRGQVWGTKPAFQIAPIHAGGSAEPTGWGAICGIHTDPNNPTLTCKKAMTCSGLSHEECRLRLKRWLAAGLATEGWGANHRESHVSMGGVQLVNFADGLPEAALDALVGHQE